jgi:hypothetical protein
LIMLAGFSRRRVAQNVTAATIRLPTARRLILIGFGSRRARKLPGKNRVESGAGAPRAE